MNVAASGVSTQVAQTRIAMTQSMIKQNAQAERQVANILTQAAEAGQKAAESGRVNIVV